MSSFKTIWYIIDELQEFLKYFITRSLIESDISFQPLRIVADLLCLVKLIFIFDTIIKILMQI